MAWYKAWLESRWQFKFGLISFLFIGLLIVYLYPQALRTANIPPAEAGPLINFYRPHELKLLSESFTSYIWVQWFNKCLVIMWPVFGLMICTGGLMAEQGGEALLTLSLPVSRRRLTVVRAFVCIGEMVTLALLPSLALTIFGLISGQRLSPGMALTYTLFTVMGGMVFIAAAFLLSTIVAKDPVYGTIGYCLLAVLALISFTVESLAPYSPFRLMCGESYFFTGAVPWKGLITTMALSAAMFMVSIKAVERRDF